MRKKFFLIILLAIGLNYPSGICFSDWGATKRITWNSGDSYDPAIAVDSSNNIHMVWCDYTPGNSEIYYKRSTDEGSTWGATKRITWNSGGSVHPAIAIDSNNNLHVVWHDWTPGNPEIYYKRSTDGGSTWSPTKRLTWNSSSSRYPAIAIDSNNNLHVVWEDSIPGNSEIYYKRSTDGGSTWGATKRLTWTSGGSYDQAMAIDSNNNLYVVWEDSTPGNYEIYYKMSTDGGSTWGATKRLTWTSGSSYEPAIAIDSNNNVHVVWHDLTPGNAEIYYKMSTDGGSTWGATKRLTWTSGDSAYPAIAIDSNNNVHVVWHDLTPGNAEIYYKMSTDGGSTWGATKRLSWNSGSSYGPAMAIDSNNSIYVVWHDKTPGNWEIYYKKGK